MKLPEEHPWQTVKAARIPWSQLPALALLRDRADVLVCKKGNDAWIRWGASQSLVIECLLGVSRVAFFVKKGSTWFPFGRLVPTALAPPEELGEPIVFHLSPLAPESVSAPAGPAGKISWKLKPGDSPQPATAMTCSLAALAAWAESATRWEIEQLKAARKGDRAILKGERLPSIAGSTRYWGTRVWIPLGFVGDPPFHEAVLIAAANLEPDAILLCQDHQREVIPEHAFGPLNRSGIKLALEQWEQGENSLP